MLVRTTKVDVVASILEESQVVTAVPQIRSNGNVDCPRVKPGLCDGLTASDVDVGEMSKEFDSSADSKSRPSIFVSSSSSRTNTSFSMSSVISIDFEPLIVSTISSPVLRSLGSIGK